MGILDDIVVNARTAAEAVSRQVGQVVDASKLRISAAEINAEVSKRYEALGEYVYENLREVLAGEAEAVGKFAEIDELKAQAEVIARELMDKQNKVVCPVCGKTMPIGSAYCSSCGAKLAEEPAAQKEEDVSADEKPAEDNEE